MMGRQPAPQENLFHYGINLDKRIRENHPLRKINELIDFDFTYELVKDRYGCNGNVSLPPPVILKLILLLLLYNVRSERELMDTLPERLDWLWFLGFNMDSTIPNHSVLSKARRRWGTDVFKTFFERVVWQCVESGLVDGSKIFVDSSLVDADASNNSVVDTESLKRHLNKSYRELEKRLEESETDEDSPDGPGPHSKVNKRYVSTTDPDASIVRRGGPKLRYQAHRAVDPKAEVITATEVTPGDVNEAHRMVPLMDGHQENTGIKTETVVADSKYGTIDNLLTCKDRDVKPHMPTVRDKTAGTSSQAGIFPYTSFIYDKATDTYRCPAGKRLKRKSLHKKRDSIDYAAPRITCAACELRPQCTRNKMGRTVKRHLRHDDIEAMMDVARSSQSKKDIHTRQHLMERSFARGGRHGMKRARWRGLWRLRIQEYLTATVQNIETLIRYGSSKAPLAMACEVQALNRAINGPIKAVLTLCLVWRELLSGIWQYSTPCKP